MDGKPDWCISGVVVLGCFIEPKHATPAKANSIAEKIANLRGLSWRGRQADRQDDPAIWGQKQDYLYIQLRDFKRGDRKNEIMQPIVILRWSAKTCWRLRNIFRRSRGPISASRARRRRLRSGPCAPMARSAAPAAISINFRATGTVPRLAGHEPRISDQDDRRFSFPRARQQSRNVRPDAGHPSRRPCGAGGIPRRL